MESPSRVGRGSPASGSPPERPAHSTWPPHARSPRECPGPCAGHGPHSASGSSPERPACGPRPPGAQNAKTPKHAAGVRRCGHGPARRQNRHQKGKTYNSGYSHVVTHRTTSPPVRSLSSGERTGSSVLCDLWSYVPDRRRAEYIYAGGRGRHRPVRAGFADVGPGGLGARTHASPIPLLACIPALVPGHRRPALGGAPHTTMPASRPPPPTAGDHAPSHRTSREPPRPASDPERVAAIRDGLAGLPGAASGGVGGRRGPSGGVGRRRAASGGVGRRVRVPASSAPRPPVPRPFPSRPPPLPSPPLPSPSRPSLSSAAPAARKIFGGCRGASGWRAGAAGVGSRGGRGGESGPSGWRVGAAESPPNISVSMAPWLTAFALTGAGSTASPRIAPSAPEPSPAGAVRSLEGLRAMVPVATVRDDLYAVFAYFGAMPPRTGGPRKRTSPVARMLSAPRSRTGSTDGEWPPGRTM